MSSTTARIAALRRRQHGVVALRQVAALGGATSTYADRVAAGVETALWPGVLVAASAPVTWEVRAQAAVLHLARDAVLSHDSAARALGLDDHRAPSAVHVTTRVRSHDGLAGITMHRTNQLPPADLTTVDGMPVTGATRTLADLAGSTGPARLRRLLRAAVRDRVTTADDVRAHLDRRGRLRGKRTLLALVDAISPLEAWTRSDLESSFLALTTGAGIPPTAVNHHVVDARGRRRVLDAVYLPQMVPVELDSRRFHGNELDRDDDLVRGNDVVLAGWRSLLRFSFHQVTRRGADVVATIRAALAAADADRSAS